MSFIKHALEKKYPVLYEKLYGQNILKNFSFSVFLPVEKILSDRYLLTSEFINVKISSSDVQLLAALYNAFLNSRFYDYNLPINNSFKLVKVSYSNTVKIISNKVLIKFLSPLIVRDHDKENNKDIYLDYTSKDFEHKLKAITENYLNQRGLEGTIFLIPVKARRTVAKCLNLNLNCSFGLFELIAKPEIIQELYLAGIGSRRSEGFGLFDIIKQDSSAEVVDGQA